MTTIIETLNDIERGINEESAFVVAAAFNLYSEAMRRREGRVLLLPQDIINVLGMCRTLLTMTTIDKDVPPAQTRSSKPTTEELEQIAEPATLRRL